MTEKCFPNVRGQWAATVMAAAQTSHGGIPEWQTPELSSFYPIPHASAQSRSDTGSMGCSGKISP